MAQAPRSAKPRRVGRRRAFTVRSIGTLRPEGHAVDWFDVSTPGLAIRVTPSGARTWYLFYRKNQTTRRVKLGTWPAVTLKKARIRALEERLRVETEGADPANERADARTVFTVGDLSDLYIKQYAKPRKRTWKDDQWRINKYIAPAWQTRAVGEITRADAHALLDKIAAEGKRTQANRVQALISKLWSFAVDREHAEHNICYRMSKRAPEVARARVLTDDELKGLWRELDKHPGDASDAIRLRLLTGARGGEVHSLLWSDVDLSAGLWILPAARAKNGQAHTVPLATAAIELLRTRRAALPKTEPRVFPGLYHQREDLRHLAVIHGKDYRWHDLRRTVATRLAAAGFSEDVIGRVLNHAKRGITATVYNVHRYDAEKRRALEAWAKALEHIATGKRGAAVLAMGRR